MKKLQEQLKQFFEGRDLKIDAFHSGWERISFIDNEFTHSCFRRIDKSFYTDGQTEKN